MKQVELFLVITATVSLYCGSLPAAPIDYVRDIKPILQKHCYACHGADDQEGELRLDIKSHAFLGGEGYGPSIIPGKAKQSPLIQFINGSDEEMQMPPEGEEPLSEPESATLTKWVDAGANWPEGVDAVEKKEKPKHWSFQPIKQTAIPTVQNPQWTRNEIDYFILAALEKNKLQPSPEADRVTWLRRIYFNLTGLPPTPEQIEAFVNDQQADACERVVDELLSSPRYGERWAQHWLDVIRWAETVGFETNLARPNAWHYRDWVIAALNSDMPYDQFIKAQIAGDTLGDDAALGFLVAGPANLPGQIGRDIEAMRQARQDELDEVIRTVGQAFYGLTIGCARCHGHKFDPITQSDYYSLQAVFAGLSYGNRRLRGPQNDQWTARIPAVRKKLEKLRAELESLRQQHHLKPPLASVQTEYFPPALVKAVRMKIRGTNSRGSASLYEFELWTSSQNGKPSTNVSLASAGSRPDASSFLLANQTRHFDNLVDGSVDRRQAFPWVAEKGGPAWIRIDLAEPKTVDRVVWHAGSTIPADYVIEVLPANSNKWKKVADTNQRLPRIDDTRPPSQVNLSGLTQKQVEKIFEKVTAIRNTEKELAKLSAGPQVYAASFTDSPEPTWLLGRGDPMKRLRQVAPAVPKAFGQVVLSVDAPEKERRLALANHLSDRNHPLTARVIVNRIWQHHFGTGIVETPSDFGEMGGVPSHPELLDWLARDFLEHGWSIKRVHRQIALSAAYRQSSRPRADGLAVDAESRLLWRFPPRRLEAEAIRDSILLVSGKLNLKMGGPGFDFFNQRGGLSDYIPKETFDETGWRRMIYAHKIRMQSVDIFGAFDCPDAGQMKPKRSRSITPIQSLSLLNSPFINRQAHFFAERVQKEVGKEPAAFVVRAYQLAFSRSPSERELKIMTDLAANHGFDQVCRVLFNTREFVYIQ